MILNEELYAKSGVWTMIRCRCDYCGIEFERSKRNIRVSRKIIQKESCNSIACVRAKRQESQIAKYGVPNAGGTKSSVEKAKQTFQQNLGVDNPAKSDSVKSKIANTCLKRYGKKSFLETDQCRAALKEYSIKNYGVENISQSSEIKNKIQKTCEERYGVSHPRKHSPNFEQFQSTIVNKYGVQNLCYLPDHLEKRQETCLFKYGVIHPVKNEQVQQKIRDKCVELYGRYPVNVFGYTENSIREWLSSNGLTCRKDYELLQGKEIDIYIPERKLGIEFCGLFWHNELSPTTRDRTYHVDKHKRLKQQGITLLTIFEDEWIYKQEVCKSVILSKLGIFSNRLYGRKTDVRSVSTEEATIFLNDNHLQGSCRFLKASGLYHEGKLVAVATYSQHHRQYDQYVLSRFCFSRNTQIVGGTSKLKNHLLENLPKGTKIITWSDNRWGSGNVYQNMGFTLEKELPPDYSYYKCGSKAIRVSKQSMKKSNTGCPRTVTERDWCLQEGYVRIWDCGKIRWGLTI